MMPGNRQGFILQLPQDRRNIQPSENIQNPRAECLLVKTVKLYQTMPYQLMAHFTIRAPPNKNNRSTNTIVPIHPIDNDCTGI